MYYLHGDPLGTVTFVTNSQSQATQFFVNLPFGETMLEQMDGSYNNPHKFNAKELDEDTGLYYYGARYYNPRLSIWYGVDPLAETIPSWSPYAYGFNNPIRFIDPTGMQGEDWYRDRYGNVSWKGSQANTIKGDNGQTLTRLGKSGSYQNTNGGVTTLNKNRTVTQDGGTSLLSSPRQMSVAH